MELTKTLTTFLLLTFLLLSVNLVIALKPDYQTVEFSTDYYSVFEKNIVYAEDINLQTSISTFSNFELTLWGDWKNGVVNVNIDGVDCSPNGWNTPNANNYKIRFDCTDAVNNAPDKTDLTLSYLTDKNADNVYGTIKTTFLDKGEPVIKVHGTEYVANDNGKIFLQLLDSSDQPITNSTCFASIYYPDDEIFKFQQLMSYLGEGIYTYSFTVPYKKGVYPVSSFCTVPDISSLEKKATDPMESTASGSNWKSVWVTDGCVYTSTYSISAPNSLSCNSGEEPLREITSNSSYESINYDFYYRLSSFEDIEAVSYFLRDADGTNFSMIDVGNGGDDGAWHKVTGTFTTATDNFNLSGDVGVGIRVIGGTIESNDYYRLEDLNLTLIRNSVINQSSYQIIRGSGEVHVNNPDNINYDLLLSDGELHNYTYLQNFTLKYQVTSQTIQNLTEQEIKMPLFNAFGCDSVLDVYVRLSNGTRIRVNTTQTELSDNDICIVKVFENLDVNQVYNYEIDLENVWKRDVYHEKASVDFDESIINDSCNQYAIENNLPNYTIPIQSLPTNQDKLWLLCSSYFDLKHHFDDELQFFLDISNITINFTKDEMQSLESAWFHKNEERDNLFTMTTNLLSSFAMINGYSLNILNDSYYPTNPDYLKYFANLSSSKKNNDKLDNTIVNETSISESVWNYSGTITQNILSQFSSSVWSAVNRTLTGFGNLVGDIWIAPFRNLTYYPNTTDETNYTLINEGVWQFTNRTLSGFGFLVDTGLNNLTAKEVWENQNRNLTYTEPVSIDYGLISDYVWNNTNRGLTTFSFIVNTTNNNLTAQDVWGYANRTLSGFDFVVDTGLVNLTAGDIWNYSNRQLSQFSFTVNTTNTNLTAQDIWGYVNRTLSSFNFSIDTGLVNLTAEDVWLNPSRNLTYYPQSTDETNYTLIGDTVWNVSQPKYTYGIIIP